MRFSAVVAALLPVGFSLAQTTHVIKVGGGSLTYQPNQLTGVQNGDVVQFQFLDKNHTVTQSTFAAPCSNITDASGKVTGVDSGYQFVDPAATQFPVWQITIDNASTPLWFYCRQAKHCQSGMVFAVNPTAAKSFDTFKTNAATSTAVNGSPVSGGAGSTNGTGTGSTNGTSTGSTNGTNTGTTGTGTGTDTGAASSNTSDPKSGTTPTPGATNPGNGAGAVRFGSGATLLSLASLSLGLLL
jgi:hypothetical protein